MNTPFRPSWFCLALVFVVNIWSQASAQKLQAPGGDSPFLLTADRIVYDYNNETVSAQGSVEIISDDRVLRADRITYNRPQKLVTASGNIVLLEPTGEVAFSEYLELDSELKTGFIDSLKILLADDSRFAANRATRPTQDRIEMSKAVYSPCRACEEAPERPLLWQIKAKQIVHLRDQQEIVYRDAVLEVFGIPIAYTPYFRHADPTVRRKTGFLTPRFGSSSDLGATFQVPFFWAIDEQRDLTFEPIISSEEGLVLAGEYRAVIQQGEYNVSGSATYVDKRNDEDARTGGQEFRGHIFGRGRFDIDDTWRWGVDVARTTDDTYLQRFRFSDADTLTSDLFIEGFSGRNYAAASTYAFQGLESEDDKGTTPFVLPLLDYGYVAEPFNGVTFTLDANAVSLYRTDSNDTRRLSVDGGLRFPWVHDSGNVLTLISKLRLDAFWLNDYVNPNRPAAGSQNDTEFRAIPLLALDWRFPLIRKSGTVRQLIEPVAQLIVTPHGGNPSTIPNEDSQSIEFDDTNLFSLNRFAGYDRIESGPRANIGLKAAAYGEKGGHIAAVAGQVFRLKDDDTFAQQTGLDDDRSDYVTGLTWVPSDFLDLAHRMRIDPERFSIQRQELYFSLGPENFRVSGTYAKIDRDLTITDLVDREEVYGALKWKIDPQWTLTADARRDLTGDGSQINTAAGLFYQDECIGFNFTFERDFTRDRDIEPSTSVNFRIVLKHLG
jgi:LPS-assembly protein